MTVAAIVLAAWVTVAFLVVGVLIAAARRPPPPERTRRPTAAPQIAGLVQVAPFVLVTPRGVEIPLALLGGDLGLDDALDWLGYVETLS